MSFFAKLLLAPVVGLIRLCQAGASVWLHALFAVVVVALPPVMLIAIMG